MQANPTLGTNRETAEPASLRLETLLRHFMALGSSGSGKTVLCKVLVEEVVRHGLPAICLDPQGDLCSLALSLDDPEALADKGVDPVLARQFAERADAVVFTPAARKGVALSADPIRVDPRPLSPRERVHAFTATATMVVSLLGYDLGSDDGEGLVAVFDKGLHLLHERGRFPRNLADFTDYWLNLDDADRGVYGRYLNAKKIDQACRRLARLDVGARRLLFHDGIPLDMEMLLGRDATAVPGKSRISVIYLNTLHSQEDKEYFVAALVQQLYTWMLDNPSQSPQALFYIDEVAPYIPPVRKPACKDGLSLLFKQARKYGVCCLMATQNPADVDYKAMSQFGSWALGRLTTRQDLKKVQPTVKSLDPVHVDAVMERLPAQKPGEFLLISPDNYEASLPLRTRWLYTRHETLDEERIEELADARWRERFPLPDAEPEAAAPSAPEPATEAADPPTLEAASAADRSPRTATPPSDEPEADARLTQHLDILAKSSSMSAAEFAEHAKVADSTARGILKRLVASGLAFSFKQGRGHRYWVKASGLRPDLGLVEPVTAIKPLIPREEAERLAHGLKERKLLGLMGDEEELAELELDYRPLYRVHFREKVRRSFWRRLWSRGHYEHRADSVYMHPRTLQLVVFDPKDGLSLHERPEELASEVADFDGVAGFERLAPADVPIDEHEWRERQSEAAVGDRFHALYQARPRSLEPVFLPLWRLHLRVPGRPGARIVTIDALSGFPLEW